MESWQDWKKKTNCECSRAMGYSFEAAMIWLGGHHGAIKSNQCQQPCGRTVCSVVLWGVRPGKTENLQVQYPCVDIYGRHRYIDFALESPESKIAIEIDGETYHNPSKVSENKYADDLLKQNSLIYDNWKVYRWIYSQLKKQPEKLKTSWLPFWAAVPCSRLLKQIFRFR